MPSPIVLIHFDEPAGVNPADALGNLDGLAVEPGIVAPAVAATWSGTGRRFLQASANGLTASDLSANGTMLPRDASIVALLAPVLGGASGPQTIVSRGLNDGSAPERYAYGLEIEEQAGNPGYLEARWFWQDGAGTVHTAPPGVFKHAGDGVEIMLTATRRWESASRVVVRYYIDRRMIAELVTANGDISGGITGSMSIGARKAGATTWGRFLNATIDELLIADYEMTAGEVAAIWDRMTVHQPAGVAMFQGLAPPGVSWFDNPSSDIAKRAKVCGQILGVGIAAIEDLRKNFLPDTAPLWIIELWEGLYDLHAKPLDSRDVRAARVLARMAADEGFSIPALQAAFSSVFGLASGDVEILESTNEQRDGFDTLEAERWSQGTIGAWDLLVGELRLTVQSGTNVPTGPTPNPCHLWTPIDREPVFATFGVSAFVQAKISSYASLPLGAFVGAMLHARVTNRTLWFGVYNNPAGAVELGYREVTNTGEIHTFTTLATIPAGPIWLRIKVAPAVGFLSSPTDTITLSWSTSGPSAGFSSVSFNTSPVYNLAGFGAHTTQAAGSDIVARFDDFVLWAPEALGPFAWFAYRDPSLPGSYDLIGANALARKVSPAHMYAGACASKSLLCGDPIAGQVGNTPMGVL